MYRLIIGSIFSLIWFSAFDIYAQTLPNDLPSPQGDDAFMRVFAYVEKKPGIVTYHYRIINDNFKDPITSFMLGKENCRKFVLEQNPTGWDGDSGKVPNSISKPDNWEIKMLNVEESLNFVILWVAVGQKEKYGIPKGSSLNGFSVTVPKEDPAYLTGICTNSGGTYDSVYAPIQNLGDLPKSCGASIHGTVTLQRKLKGKSISNAPNCKKFKKDLKVYCNDGEWHSFDESPCEKEAIKTKK